MQKEFRHRVTHIGLFLTSVLLLMACSTVALPPGEIQMGETQIGEIQTLGLSKANIAAPDSQEIESYETVMTVLTHPRCSNCHPTDDSPRQNDDQIAHILNVTRGENNHGGPVQSCETCHHEENNPYSLVPGAPHWGLAPESMGWLGLSHAEIAQSLIDPAKNGNRSFDELIEHVSEDALVLWGWEPGPGRTAIPVPHDEFVQAMQTWLDAGAPIPGK